MGQPLPVAESPEVVARSIHEAAVFLWREATLAGLHDLAESLSVVARQARDDAAESGMSLC